MPIDARIPLGVEVPRYQPPDIMGDFSRVISIKEAMRRGRLQEEEAERERQEADRTRRRREIFQNSKDYSSYLKTVKKEGLINADEALKTERAWAEADEAFAKKTVEEQKAEEATVAAIHDAVGAVKAGTPQQRPALWAAAVRRVVGAGLVPEGKFDPNQYPGDDEIEMMYSTTMKEQTRIENALKASADKRAQTSAEILDQSRQAQDFREQQKADRDRGDADRTAVIQEVGAATSQDAYQKVYNRLTGAQISSLGLPDPKDWTKETPRSLQLRGMTSAQQAAATKPDAPGSQAINPNTLALKVAQGQRADATPEEKEAGRTAEAALKIIRQNRPARQGDSFTPSEQDAIERRKDTALTAARKRFDEGQITVEQYRTEAQAAQDAYEKSITKHVGHSVGHGVYGVQGNQLVFRNAGEARGAQPTTPAPAAPSAPQQQASQPGGNQTAQPAQGGSVSLTLPNGKVATFPNRAALDAFLKETGLSLK